MGTVVQLRPANIDKAASLGALVPGYREKLDEMVRLAEIDQSAAERAFADAQALVRAFHAGIEHACGVEG